MIIIEKNAGQKIDWTETGTIVGFGDDELTVNCAKYQKDWAVHLDICADYNDNLVIGTASGRSFVAQLDIPEQQYVYPEEPSSKDEGDSPAEQDPPTPVPLDMNTVTLTLWAII
jgi:hypothetical protein